MRPTHSLIYLCAANSVCLGFKKRGFGTQYWNGFGGKIEHAETPAESAVRELHEESGVVVHPEQLELVATLEFVFTDGTTILCETFIAREWQGEPAETEEMMPQWFAYNQLPYEKMWESDKEWLPRVLAGERLQGRVQFDETGRGVQTSRYQPLVA